MPTPRTRELLHRYVVPVLDRCRARRPVATARLLSTNGFSGTIAFTTMPPSSVPVCVSVVEAAGVERPRNLGCDRGYRGSLRWDDDGFVRVSLRSDERGEEEATGRRARRVDPVRARRRARGRRTANARRSRTASTTTTTTTSSPRDP
jgi:hypothetical protein